MITKEQFTNQAAEVYDACYKILNAKNADYATAEDPLKNFRLCQILANITVEKGVFVRLSDKISRIGVLLDKAPTVENEKMSDTINDAINYLVILQIALKDK